MGRRRRSKSASAADRHASDLAGRLGAALRDARLLNGLTQAKAATRAGLIQTTWSKLERDRDARYTLGTWDRAAHAVGTCLNAFLPRTSPADQPRDAVHLRNQELVLRTVQRGGWRGLPEAAIDRDAGRSRHADVLLERSRAAGNSSEYAVCEVWDWLPDVGDGVRDFQRRLAAVDCYAVARMRGDEVPRTSGFWLVRATQRNLRLLDEHRHFFRSRFPGSGRAWLAALTSPAAPMPAQAALLWVDVGGTRIFEARLGSG